MTPPATLQAFRAFLSGLCFPNFGPNDFLDYVQRPRNSVPPPELWGNIVPTLAVAQAMRDEFGACTVLSSYRATDYNKRVRGAPMSLHLAFNALDLTFRRGEPGDWYRWVKEARGKRFTAPVAFTMEPRGLMKPDGLKINGRGFEFRGGTEAYERQNFIHVDTRGFDVDWKGY